MSKIHFFPSAQCAYFRSFRHLRDEFVRRPIGQINGQVKGRVKLKTLAGMMAVLGLLSLPGFVQAQTEGSNSVDPTKEQVQQKKKSKKSSKSSSKTNISKNAQSPLKDEAATSYLPLRLEDQLIVQKPAQEGESPTFTSSDSIEGTNDRIMNLKGNAEVRRAGSFVKGERITYDPDTDIAEVEGNARFYKDNTLFTGPKTRLKLDSRLGWMEEPEYEFRANHASGKADRADFLDEDKILLTNPTYSTCSPDNLDWYFSASRMEIDQEQKVGTAKNGTLHFKGLPIFYSPSFEIPMSSERKSGWLAPAIGLSSVNGMDVTTPYYYNIAPNRDLTLYPRFLSLRGAQLGGQFRYLEPKYSGVIRAEYLPNDSAANRDRWAYSINHQQIIAPGLRGYANINRVSDDLYADNLGRSLGQAITRQFNQEAGLNYGYQGWNFLTRVQKFQTLQPDPLNPVGKPYDREPQLNARYRNINWNGAIVNFESDYTRFALSQHTPLSVVPNGGYYNVERSFFNTSVAFPYMTPGYFLTPKVSFRGNNYRSESTNLLSAKNESFTVPTFSLDSGLYFERDATELQSLFGRAYIMTLEPRVFYVYTPYRDQSSIPLLDTAPFGMGIYQIFSENTFVGNDRVADNNKVTSGITSRIIDGETGTERLRMTVAQRVDLGPQRVGLNGNLIPDPTQGSNNKYSDILMAASTRLMGNLNLDIFNQHNYQLNRSVQTVGTASWRPSARRMINLSHRYTFDQYSSRPTVHQNEISGQWPLTKKLYGIGRWNYDQISKKTLNTLAGLEYDEECWAFRVVLQRFVNTSQLTTSQIFFQLEFKGLSGFGNNPGNIIRMNIPGYVPGTPAREPMSPFERYE